MHTFTYSVILILLFPFALTLRTPWKSQASPGRLVKLFSAAAGEAESGTLKARLSGDMKAAMKAKDKAKLAVVRSVQNAIKQKEIDDRQPVDDDAAVLIMSKLMKQRKESIKSYKDGGRNDLADAEQFEYDVIATYMPAQMSPEEIQKVIEEAIAKVGASTIKDMGKVMAEVRPVLVGKADMSEVGGAIKKLLSC